MYAEANMIYQSFGVIFRKNRSSNGRDNDVKWCVVQKPCWRYIWFHIIISILFGFISTAYTFSRVFTRSEDISNRLGQKTTLKFGRDFIWVYIIDNIMKGSVFLCPKVWFFVQIWSADKLLNSKPYFHSNSFLYHPSDLCLQIEIFFSWKVSFLKFPFLVRLTMHVPYCISIIPFKLEDTFINSS